MSERWTEFEGRPNRRVGDVPRVTLNKRGVLLLNRVAYDALGAPAAVQFFYDEDSRVIGLKPEDARAANAFPVKQKDKWFNRTIYAHPFLQALWHRNSANRAF